MPKVAPTRDPEAYRRARRDAAIQRNREITQCYEEHHPPQIVKGLVMQACTGHMPVMPKFVKRGESCLTIFKGLEHAILATAA